ncbi:MAG: hypothetical protein V1809_10635 [Planctomycetota bacterium]
MTAKNKIGGAGVREGLEMTVFGFGGLLKDKGMIVVAVKPTVMELRKCSDTGFLKITASS